MICLDCKRAFLSREYQVYTNSKFNIIIEKYGVEPDELEQAFDSLAYLILHIAKVKANESEFEIIFDQSTLNPAFKKPFFDVYFTEYHNNNL
jgi:hypothetical protein